MGISQIRHVPKSPDSRLWNGILSLVASTFLKRLHLFPRSIRTKHPQVDK
ncbi:MAG: hypothetical protein OXF84_14355 [Bacteroidetes bacterium]|nr:hypothetical protein [Bacteroidota bacterium]